MRTKFKRQTSVLFGQISPISKVLKSPKGLVGAVALFLAAVPVAAAAVQSVETSTKSNDDQVPKIESKVQVRSSSADKQGAEDSPKPESEDSQNNTKKNSDVKTQVHSSTTVRVNGSLVEVPENGEASQVIESGDGDKTKVYIKNETSHSNSGFDDRSRNRSDIDYDLDSDFEYEEDTEIQTRFSD